jgi:hypothetical protein
MIPRIESKPVLCKLNGYPLGVTSVATRAREEILSELSEGISERSKDSCDCLLRWCHHRYHHPAATIDILFRAIMTEVTVSSSSSISPPLPFG